MVILVCIVKIDYIFGAGLFVQFFSLSHYKKKKQFPFRIRPINGAKLTNRGRKYQLYHRIWMKENNVLCLSGFSFSETYFMWVASVIYISVASNGRLIQFLYATYLIDLSESRDKNKQKHAYSVHTSQCINMGIVMSHCHIFRVNEILINEWTTT